MSRYSRIWAFGTLCICTLGVAIAAQPGMRSQSTRAARSAALFDRMAVVLQSPRCMNCHTDTQYPRQGDDRHRHTMHVARGPEGFGAPGLHCDTCHRGANQVNGVPGAVGWHLAPLRMGWEGLTVPELCRALRDPRRGNMPPSELVAHFKTPLILWAWKPGIDLDGRARATPPIPYAKFMALTREWIATGAACPAH